MGFHISSKWDKIMDIWINKQKIEDYSCGCVETFKFVYIEYYLSKYWLDDVDHECKLSKLHLRC